MSNESQPSGPYPQPGQPQRADGSQGYPTSQPSAPSPHEQGYPQGGQGYPTSQPSAPSPHDTQVYPQPGEAYPQPNQGYPQQNQSGQPYGAPQQPYASANQPYGPANQSYPQPGQGYPQPNQPYPQAGQPYVPPTPPKKGRPGWLLPLIIGLVLLAVIGTAAALLRRPSTGGGNKMPDQGTCISLTENTKKDDIDWKQSDCKGTATAMTFYVARSSATSLPICPQGDYLKYSLKPTSGTSRSAWSTCLIPNFQKGQCYDTDAKIPTPVDCASSNATARVEGAYSGSDDESLCSSAAYSYSEPKRLYCMVKP